MAGLKKGQRLHMCHQGADHDMHDPKGQIPAQLLITALLQIVGLPQGLFWSLENAAGLAVLQEQVECAAEASVLASLHCPYIIQYFDSFIEQVDLLGACWLRFELHAAGFFWIHAGRSIYCNRVCQWRDPSLIDKPG